MKYVIIKTGGKQIKTWTGKSIWVEKISNEIGETIFFDDVLAIYDGENFHVGTPKLDAKIKGIVEKQGKGRKLVIFRTKQKSNWSKKQGHRQPYTRIYVTEINLNGKTIEKIDFKVSSKQEKEAKNEDNGSKIEQK